MNNVFRILLMLAVAIQCNAQGTRSNSAYLQYIDRYAGLAVEQMKLHGIPASITLAQGLIESGAGQSELARKGNNHFGIKCHGWQGNTVYHDDDAAGECFRAYDNVRQSYEDHSMFLVRGSRYRNLFSLSTSDYRGWARGLKAAGYATNPSYAEILIRIIEQYCLYEYDRDKPQPQKPIVTEVEEFGVLVRNNTPYVVVRNGETLSSISRQTGVSVRKLAKYNEMPRDMTLIPGSPIYLEKKPKHASRVYKGKYHEVRAGESIHSIAQLYAMRVETLYKINRLPDYYGVKVGDKLRIR
ncbi:MAG: glucosaminidase domain-containing protein [Prevotella sp.]|uniref:glucosaminidase domain-containing protein n=1 Tax=Prevotella sp. TaxID=59823 RepID=UPI002A2AB2F8|nr:glucosaminidase domain-containing protein [Prevotella sp.]MDD7318671.1 glucosaminidase domain-containing protein [Prevotellaceae bacterium]MDY4019373.1 glucosaminidase domain-containing protein [Prevotella sp.]